MCQTDTSARAYLYVLDACFSEDDKALFLFLLIVFCLFFHYLIAFLLLLSGKTQKSLKIVPEA